ncbi:MAG: aminotransferase [Candidatus Melainabacteria bacterium HGW-Melainabacteria-1]|nr:MAG: aminotransferase [Candidatus Melainabacteria bacterium HGW-Melainabacteria-1]
MSRLSAKSALFGESIIRNMSLVCRAAGALNLAQGLPEDDTPESVKAACISAIQAGHNQYARTWGIPELGRALAAKMQWFQGYDFDPETELTICCGGTEAMMAAFLATLDPGDEVLIPYPYYENYRAELLLCGATPVFVPLSHGSGDLHFGLDLAALEAAITPRSKGIVINSPQNPTGKVYSQAELMILADFACRHNLLVYTDETYEHMVYAGHSHLSPITLPGMRERTIVISSLSKTYAATGWRVAWAIAEPELTEGIRKVHDFLTIAAPHPMQHAAATALSLPRGYYDELLARYTHRRQLLCDGLEAAGFRITWPEGAYYVLVNLSGLLLPGESVYDFSLRLIREAGVAGVPGTAFMPGQAGEAPWLRLSFCKQASTLASGVERLGNWRARQ